MKQEVNKQKGKRQKLIKDTIIMTFGMMVGAMAVHFFLEPLALIIGSISGLSIVIEHLTSIPVSYTYFTISIFLLLLAYILIGAEFSIKTIFTSLITAPWLLFFEKITPIQKAGEVITATGEVLNSAGEKINDAWYVLMTIPKEGITGNVWYDLICFILILSVVQTILFHISASTGGLDIIAKIVHKYTSLSLGVCLALSGAVLCCTAFLIHPAKMVLIGLFGTALNGIALNLLTKLLLKLKKDKAPERQTKPLQ